MLPFCMPRGSPMIWPPLSLCNMPYGNARQFEVLLCLILSNILLDNEAPLVSGLCQGPSQLLTEKFSEMRWTETLWQFSTRRSEKKYSWTLVFETHNGNYSERSLPFETSHFFLCYLFCWKQIFKISSNLRFCDSVDKLVMGSLLPRGKTV